MATGGAVVCTDAHGNRDFCVDGENCLMPEARAAAVARVDQPAARRSRRSRRVSARRASPRQRAYDWAPRIEALERFMFEIAQPRKIEPSTSGAGAPRLAAKPGALEILGHPRSDPVEHPEADHEDRHHDPDRHEQRRLSSPSSDEALGVSWVMNACRNCWKITASGLSM